MTTGARAVAQLVELYLLGRVPLIRSLKHGLQWRSKTANFGHVELFLWREWSSKAALVKGTVKRAARLSVRLPDDVLDRLRIVAKIEGRSAADWAYRAIEAALLRAETQLARRNKGNR
jgi:hypothetical protein